MKAMIEEKIVKLAYSNFRLSERDVLKIEKSFSYSYYNILK